MTTDPAGRTRPPAPSGARPSPPIAPTRRTVRGAGVDLAAYESGERGRPTVVLVHGFPDTAALWEDVAARLVGRYHVVTYDVRGAGASSAPPRRSDYRLKELVDDMAAIVDAVSPDRPVHLVGHDWGSLQCWEAVTTGRLTGRLRSYTSIAGPCLDHLGYWVRARMRLDRRALGQLLDQARRSWYVAAFCLPGGSLFWRRGGDRLVVRILRRTGDLAPGERLAPTLAADGEHGVQLYRANVVARLLRPQHRSTDVPVQVLWGNRDRYLSRTAFDDVDRWASRLWCREVGSGHWSPRSHPDTVATCVSELVGHIEGGPEPEGLVSSRGGDHSGE